MSITRPVRHNPVRAERENIVPFGPFPISSREGRKSHDISRMVLFLADSLNDFITGRNFIVDGGMTKKMIYEEYSPQGFVPKALPTGKFSDL
ncbi:hypothetical protein EHQ61_11190 [Leptospira wolffii]|nr:hypothetical protein EHQ61_11190 [Leptospira wolffii]